MDTAMFSKRTPQSPSDAYTRYRATKASAPGTRRGTRSSPNSNSSRRLERRRKPATPSNAASSPSPTTPSPSTSPIVMLRVGPSTRLFAAHEAVLSASPFFAARCHPQTPSPTPPARLRPPLQPPGKRIELPAEQPEVLSCVLEFLYKGDYSPRLKHNARRQAWELEDTGTDAEGQSIGATVFHQQAGEVILRDTAIYCAAEKYGLPTLQRLALRKQGLHTGIQCSTILASARYAYAHTPDTESRLRAHYLALIIRCRETFKRSGTMQMEMERGGKLIFDLFVAMCNHMDDVPPSTISVCSSAATTH
ncbi:hypothetical protein NUU61_009380 [Penicillium alfredii]|uniref:BTB domain-containing protein n=1 Tax=Penicillium alfredii TaxID=1506179 RepID=A0A9W9EN05_9EURO|nr:uncharacterized protein NUU61_009380 [Penicillium alfredii]KAJ5084801.1 hypothetical protein NUU61_009380 [Penicillium alfredii]